MAKRAPTRHPSRLVAFGVSVAGWTRRFGVVPFTHPCSDCGEPRTTSLPFAEGSLRGLVAPPCPCGNPCAPYCLILEGPHGLGGLEPERRPRRPRDRPSGIYRVP